MQTIRKIITYLFSKISPVKKNRIVFLSFNGHYSDSPKYISDAIYQLNPQIEQIWLLDSSFQNHIPSHFKFYAPESIKGLYYYSTAQLIIDNVYGNKEAWLRSSSAKRRILFSLISWLKKKSGQYVITTWHGTPLKRMGRDQVRNTIIDFNCHNAEMILGNQFTLDIMKHLTFGKIPMHLLGTPRNDILFSSPNEISDIKKKLGLPNDKKIILFAPTFRNDGIDTQGKNVFRSGLDQLESIAFDVLFSTLTEKFGGDWVFVCRFHYHVEQMVDWKALEEKYPGKFINGNLHDDMAEYLVCADILLTDASSCMFDYALTKRPCFLYFPDLDHYATSERGLYLNIEDLPFPCSTDFEALIDQIKEFDPILYTRQIEKMILEMNYVDEANSSMRVASFILEKINQWQ